MQTAVISSQKIAGSVSKEAGQMPLPMATCGEIYTVASVRGKDETKNFLASLGFAPGAQVSVVCQMGGNLIINVKGSRVALGCSMAQRIQVQ